MRLIKLPIYESPGDPVPDLLDAAVDFSGDAATPPLEPSDDAIGEEKSTRRGEFSSSRERQIEENERQLAFFSREVERIAALGLLAVAWYSSLPSSSCLMIIDIRNEGMEIVGYARSTLKLYTVRTREWKSLCLALNSHRLIALGR